MKRIDFDRPHQFFFETLGNETRWDIVQCLRTRPYRATAIAKELAVEQSLVSHHLKRLETCGFVQVKTNGTQRVYSLNEQTIGPLLKLVDKHVNRFCKKICCR